MDAVQDVPSADGSAVPEPSAPSNVVHLPCRCPRTPHAEDLIVLTPRVPMALGAAAMFVIDNASTKEQVFGDLAALYLEYGIVGWNLVDSDGKPLAITKNNVATLVPFEDGGWEVAEAADALYQEPLMRPLRRRYPERFQPSPMGSSTSATPDGGSTPPTPSEPSSPNDTAGQPSEVPA